MREKYVQLKPEIQPLTSTQEAVLEVAKTYKSATGNPAPQAFIARRLEITRQRIGQVSHSLREMGYPLSIRTREDIARKRRKRRKQILEELKRRKKSLDKNQKILNMAKRGFSNDEIAERLGLTRSAVEHRRARLRSKHLLEKQKPGPRNKKREGVK